VIWLGTRQQLFKLSATDKSLQLSDGQLCAAMTVRNLGVQTDEQISFDSQSRSCPKACYYHLQRIRQIRKYVNDEAVRSLVHAFVTSRLDYCNSLYAYTPVCLLVRDSSVYETVQHV